MAGVGAELRQGEIITQLTRYDFSSSSGGVTPTDLPISIVFTQDCDLLGDFENRAAGGLGELDHVLLMTAYSVIKVKEMTKFGSKEMKPLQQNLNPRWHYLEKCPSSLDVVGGGLESMVVDFRSLMAMPVSEIYHQCEAGISFRRTLLETPYKEHFQVRAANFLSRIAVPSPHSF